MSVNGAGQRRGGLLARVQRGVVAARPLRMCVYGVKGVGKSTFAAGARKPVFADCEEGTKGIDVPRAYINEWGLLRQFVRELTHDDHDHGSFVIDTVDAADRFAQAAVCAKKNWGSVGEQEFGRGWDEVELEWVRLLDDLSALQAKRGVNLILLGHAQVSRMRPPDAEEYDAWAPRLNKRIASLIGGWADEVLFANYAVEVKRTKKGRSTGRAESGRRVLHTSWSPAIDAKNRRQLPPVLPLDWAALAAALRRGASMARAPEPEPDAQDDLVIPPPDDEPAQAGPLEPDPIRPVDGAPDRVGVDCDELAAEIGHYLSVLGVEPSRRAKVEAGVRVAVAKKDLEGLLAARELYRAQAQRAAT